MSSDPIQLDPDDRSRLTEVTGGAANVCFQCGTCTATCPWYELNGEPLTVRSMMRSAQLSTDGYSEMLYRCLTCRACESACPRGVDIVDAITGLRELAFERDEAPGRLESALWSVYEDDNPLERPSNQRDAWFDAVPDHVDLPVNEPAEVLYYVGCSASYDPALQSVPASIVQLLSAADVDYTVMGNDEVCCGDVVRQTGEAAFFDQLAETNAAAFDEIGPKTIITSSPHCSMSFTDEYDLDADVVHYTEYLSHLLASGTLEFGDLDRVVTFHDPCYLARGMDVVEAPRNLLEAAGVEIREMKRFGTDTLCCGGGGGHMFQEVETEERFADRRAKQAAGTGAEEFVTACPYCVQTLEDGTKTTNVGLEVRELSTVLLEAVTVAPQPEVNLE